MDEKYLHDADLANLLGVSVKALRNKICLGDPLPPHIQLPGLRVRLWPQSKVDEWIRQYIEDSVAADPKKDNKVRKAAPPGRPRKARWNKEL